MPCGSLLRTTLAVHPPCCAAQHDSGACPNLAALPLPERRLESCPYATPLPEELRLRVQGLAKNGQRHYALNLVVHYDAELARLQQPFSGIPRVRRIRSGVYCCHCDGEDHSCAPHWLCLHHIQLIVCWSWPALQALVVESREVFCSAPEPAWAAGAGCAVLWRVAQGGQLSCWAHGKDCMNALGQDGTMPAAGMPGRAHAAGAVRRLQLREGLPRAGRRPSLVSGAAAAAAAAAAGAAWAGAGACTRAPAGRGGRTALQAVSQRGARVRAPLPPPCHASCRKLWHMHLLLCMTCRSQ
jgi:hypothetical protein